MSETTNQISIFYVLQNNVVIVIDSSISFAMLTMLRMYSNSRTMRIDAKHLA